MTTKIKRFQPEHLDEIELRENQQFVAVNKSDIAELGVRGPAFTVFAENKIILCGGIVDMWPGVGEIWVLTSIDFPKFRKTAIRYCRRFMAKFRPYYHRIQATVRSDILENYIFALRFGFKYEGNMLKYDMFGNSHIRMAVVR